MTVKDSNGNQVPGDWSCYLDDAGATFFDLDDASSDAGDAGTVDAGGPTQDAGNPTPDAAPPPPEDAGTDAAGPPPDGDASPPPPETYLLQLLDFSTLAPPSGSTVSVFWGESVLGDAAVTGALDEAGVLSFAAPPAGTLNLSYHLFANSTQAAVYWHGAPIVPPNVDAGAIFGNGRTLANSVSLATQQALITSVFGSESAQANLAVLTTAARDCQGRDVTGAQFTLVDGATGNSVTAGASGSAAPRGFYFLDNFPDINCTYTNNEGIAAWAMANAPVNEQGSLHQYTLQMSGRRSTNDPATGVLLGSVDCELFSAGISTERPYRLSLSVAPNL
jgi:hypothetical protein